MRDSYSVSSPATPTRTGGRLARRLGRALAFALVLLPATARADVVTTWVAVAEFVAPRYGGPQQQTRAFAMIQISVHDALNTIQGRYQRYAATGPLSPSASPDAAVAAASRRVMLELLAPIPDSPAKDAALAAIQTAFDATVGPGPYDAPTTAGLAVGEAAADAILDLRAGDGSDNPHLPYDEPVVPGVHQPTPNPEFPAVTTPLFANWANVTTFSINHSAQFEVEPGAIFDLLGDAYTAEYNEVKSLGDARVRGSAANANSELTDIARFWPGGGANWNANTRTIVGGRGLDRWGHARLFAMMNMAQADAAIANQKWKYTYNFWRPVTAIRWPDDGNPNTASDPIWRPLLNTPPYPDFPSALSVLTGAATSVLREFFGADDIPFTATVTVPSLPLPAPLVPLAPKTITRNYTSLSQAASEAQMSRVYAGLHYREACTAGGLHGTKIGRFVVRTELRPVRGKN
jgi:hypothetical protein